MASISGIIKVDKSATWTSFDAVNKIRSTLEKDLRQKGESSKLKVGHSGTLDPFATGLLLVAYGKCTKQLEKLLKLDKTYQATLVLGASSTTGDIEGEITPAQQIAVDKVSVNQVLASFRGEIKQTPPQYSAIKIDGVAAYKRARRGEVVEIEPRTVQIFDLQLDEIKDNTITFTAHVGSGTYIRTLGEDIAKSLGTAGYLSRLRRTHIGKYTVDGAISLDDIDAPAILGSSFDC